MKKYLTKYKTEKRAADNTGLASLIFNWQKSGFSASYDSFVVGSSEALRLNFCAKDLS